ncbi:MAG: hypothetical protein AB7N73_00070 [Gemmatimonadales bacterium]|nr:hypothetical protein [Gemmatimonadales bacterium]HPF62012.1 hypothetical protein [Gemmatimonadales bacterium]
MLPELTVRPGEGERWERLAAWLAERIPVEEVDGIWVFRIVRREQKEYGTAIVSLVTGERRRILTASYTATIKGRDRGGFTADMVEVGSGPVEALHELLALVPVRADDEDPPADVEIATWFPPAPAPTGADGGADEAPDAPDA